MTRCGARLSISVLMMLAWRNLWRRTGRTVLTASGVALGLGFLLARVYGITIDFAQFRAA